MQNFGRASRFSPAGPPPCSLGGPVRPASYVLINVAKLVLLLVLYSVQWMNTHSAHACYTASSRLLATTFHAKNMSDQREGEFGCGYNIYCNDTVVVVMPQFVDF